MVLMSTGSLIELQFGSFHEKLNVVGLCAYLELFNLTP